MLKGELFRDEDVRITFVFSNDFIPGMSEFSDSDHIFAKELVVSFQLPKIV